MSTPPNDIPDHRPVTTGENEAIRHFKRAVGSGTHWYIALLEAICLWEIPEETTGVRSYRYLIDNEAFDWLLLAERICSTVSFLPEEERNGLLFHGRPPLKLTTGEFQNLIGAVKYHQYLNYFYGIIAEEALVKEVEEEVSKEYRISGYLKGRDAMNEAYRRIYGSTRALLLRKFRKEKKYAQLRSIKLPELNEFTYWLFKYRLRQSDKAKVASDTKKALDWLEKHGYFSRFKEQETEPDEAGYPVASCNG